MKPYKKRAKGSWCQGKSYKGDEGSERQFSKREIREQLAAAEEKVEMARETLEVVEALLNEIMRTGTTSHGNTIEASLAYEALAFLSGERTIDDLKRIKALPSDFPAAISPSITEQRDLSPGDAPNARKCPLCKHGAIEDKSHEVTFEEEGNG